MAPLVAAFDRLADSRPDPVLVLGGQPGWGMADTERALAAARHGDRIVRTGYLPDPAVPALLRRASVVAYPAISAIAVPSVVTRGAPQASASNAGRPKPSSMAG